jgi:thiosulfate reductase cytochrome b subunit
MNDNMKKIYLYTRYERLWHWFQMLLIMILLVTGFEVHGTFSLLGFGKAVQLHNIVGIVWPTSFLFFVFWVFTTGEWKHYVPTTKLIVEVARYYSIGIFKGEKHPYTKSVDAKHNPLQRITYLMIAAVFLTFQIGSGLLYFLYTWWSDLGLTGMSLEAIAVAHLIGGFIILQFLVVHAYMVTTGHTVFAHIKSMITGWDEVEK